MESGHCNNDEVTAVFAAGMQTERSLLAVRWLGYTAGRVHHEGTEILRRRDHARYRANDGQQPNWHELVRFFVPDFGELPLQFAFAKLTIIPVHFESVILENLNFAVYICESVCIRLIVHDVSPLTRILLCRAPNGTLRSRVTRG